MYRSLQIKDFSNFKSSNVTTEEIQGFKKRKERAFIELKNYLILPKTFDCGLVDQELGFRKIFEVVPEEIYLEIKTSQPEIFRLLTKAAVHFCFVFNIPKINIDNQEPFIKKADLMLELNKKLQELKQNFINELNLEKVPTKLQKFEELDFDDFVKEYAKAKKLKFADKLEERNFKNEWQRLFENDKKEVLEIQNQINITDKEIDQMVYKLYDLTPDEIKIIKEIKI